MNIDDVLDLMQDVPDYQNFMSVDELSESSQRIAAKYPRLVERIPLGTSTGGTPIEALKIGEGSRTGLMYAMPHPNEPIGSMMLEFLLERLAQDAALLKALDFTWYIIKCIDVDGTRLNEGWFKAPFSLTNYARHFYRPPSHQQAEWCFPVDYKTLHFNKPLPETRALMNLIGGVKPDFIYSLHNSGFGGVYAYISHDRPAFYPDFYRIVESQNLPLHLGEPEAPYIPVFSKAIFKALTISDAYDFMQENGVEDPAEALDSGGNSYEYAMQFKEVWSLVCETPYFYNPAIHDTSPSDVIRRDAILESLAHSRRHLAFCQEQYDRIKNGLKSSSPFRDAIESHLESSAGFLDAQENWARSDPALAARASVAEKFDNFLAQNFYNLLNTGMFVRMLRSEIESCGASRALVEALEFMERTFDHESGQLEKELKYEVIPIQKLVRVQLGAGLLYSGFVG